MMTFYDEPASYGKSRRHLSEKNYTRLMFHTLYSVLLIGAIATQLNYLAYKFYIYSGHVDELLSRPWVLVLLFCECVYLCATIFSAIDNLLPPSSRPDLGLLDTSQKSCPTVDVFIPCCKEPTEVPMESVKAALALDYPTDLFNVYVLDDGGDDGLRSFCDALKVETVGRLQYIRREKRNGVPHNFKCGNMNNGLTYSNSDYVIMMDADMILHPSYLRRVLPHIINSPEVCFVQIPQTYYNLPVGDPLNDSCIIGYERTLLHRDSLGTASCVGTGACFRRKQLDEIGGFQPQSITEDTMTAFVLFNQGYESVYINEKLQIGLTPWTLEGYVKQRQRWGKGAIQQFSASWRACLGSKSQLNFIQKLLYFYHTGYYFLSFNNCLLMGVLLSALAFNWKLSVGTEIENVTLVKQLSLYLVMSRLAYLSFWFNIPLGLQMRNRDESHFWWMTPYFMEMCIDALRNFKASFVFIPSSNIDRKAAAAHHKAGFPPRLTKFLSQIKLVRFHLAYVITAILVILLRANHSVNSGDCSEKLLLVGLSLFLFGTSLHMLVPVIFILFPPGFKPSQRKSLLRYNSNGVPVFHPEDGLPKWSWTVLPYEILGWTNLAFWAAVLIVVIRNPTGDKFMQWCKAS